MIKQIHLALLFRECEQNVLLVIMSIILLKNSLKTGEAIAAIVNILS